jgi:predicted phage terminase large subunit-like protein
MVTKAQAAAELLHRRQARKSLQSFIRYINPEYIVSDFSQTVCSELERFYSDAIQGLRPVLILGAPPQHGKSDMVSRYAPAWFFGQNPDLSIGGLSYGKDLATDMNRDVQRIMMSEQYANIFPETTLNSKRVVTVEVEAKRNSETFEIVGAKGRYIAQGVGGPLTGKRLDIGIIDDPIKNAAEALSETVKEGIWNWYITTFQTRLSQRSGQIIMATRWATDDLSGRIIATNPRARVLSFPAISEDGQALVPELHSLEKLLEQKAGMSDYFWSAMYQQSPTIQGGGIFKDEWWQYRSAPPAIQWRAIYADTAMKAKEQNDYSVFQCWGKTLDGQAILLDMVRGKFEAPELLERARAFWAKHAATQGQGTLRAFKIEDKASGTGLIQQLRREGKPVIGIPRTAGQDKITRAYDAAPYIESGNVLLMRDCPYLSDLLAEASGFPNAAHDDTIDPMMDAIMDILQPAKGQGYFTAL